MASPTRKVKARRKINAARHGMPRKNKVRNQGSTDANLPLDKPNANERAQAAKQSA